MIATVTSLAGVGTNNRSSSSSSSSSQQQILVRFQDKTHVVSIPSSYDKNNDNDNKDHVEEKQRLWLLSFASKTTGWPLKYLRVSSWQLPFCDISIVSSLRGGKGGFGTLLKGQSRQAGAKLTTDFGACRDLQGRRLRHVNDEIKLRKWRDMERRKQAGEKIPDDELWKTPSGIYNWHLMTPTWADISKKAAYRIKRQFKKLDEKEQKKILLKKEEEAAYQKSMTHYLEQATSAVETIQQEIPDAIKQGMAAAASTKKRKLPTNAAFLDPQQSQQQQPNSLCTLSGDAVVVVNKSLQLQSKSDFCTAVLVLDRQTPPNNTKKNPILYYEVTLVTGGLAQIGWACLVDEHTTFTPNNELGDGVGDDAASFAMDGSRGLKFHAGTEQPYGGNANGQQTSTKTKWKEGDRLGCLFHTLDGTISFTLNGNDLGTAFTTTTIQSSLVPAFSCNRGEILELHITQDDCRYFPDQAVAVRDLVLMDEEPSSLSLSADHSQKIPPSEEDQHKIVVDKASEGKSDPPSDAKQQPSKKEKKQQPVKPEPLDLEPFQSAQQLEALGLNRLKGALMAIQVKCGGTLTERAARLFSLKGLERKAYPKKVRAKGFFEW